jgi:carboxymethylenebutenolidase
MQAVAEKLADYGYLVLLPDLSYRAGTYPPMDGSWFGDPEKRKTLMEKFVGPTTPGKVMSDTRAFLAYLESQPDVKPGPIGTTGYCLGGLMSLTAAGTFGARVGAAASYHGGRLVNDAPDSPHKLAPKMKARVYVAGAIEDHSFTDEQKTELDAALTAAGVNHLVETYPAKHGWVMRDFPVYDAAGEERHWQTLTKLFNETIAAA